MGERAVVGLPRVPECAPWCQRAPHGWDNDGHAITHICTRTMVIRGNERDTELTLERFSDVDETGRAVITEPVVRVNGGEPYPVADMMQIADALRTLTDLGQLAA